jgi:hypothetical protein
MSNSWKKMLPKRCIEMTNDDAKERKITVTFIWGSRGQVESPFLHRNTLIYVQAVSFEGNAV